MNKFLSLIFNSSGGKTNDELGEYPVKLHVPAMPERRYLNTTRIMTLMSVCSLCIMMVLAIFLYLLPPQVRSIPEFAVLNDLDNNVQQIGGFSQQKEATSLITEKLVSDYVILKREVVPNVEAMKDRYKEDGLLSTFSNTVVFARMLTDSARLLRDVQNHGLKREVKILWAKPLAANVWRVRYETIDTYKDREEPEVNSWFAIVKFSFIPHTLSREALMKNPFGFVVSEYKDVKGANHPEDAERFIFEE